ncbi:zinc finger, CCCH-type [Artemisia annua]|uniref:Zinc finger, CCCH-type n=1 Tax=Artemisia annua TaxID=35608 RepID=A0A2U1N4D6_ARTAN|nr:zinc finger, CCCH-type [Artemisia annua]
MPAVPCRNFQRGYCQYGERCKYLHSNPQPKPNPFGFGSQSATQNSRTTQPQQPNPFGFGVQNNNQSGSKPNQFKPGDNKWSRFAQTNGGSSSASQKQDNQQSAANHTCTDPQSCKRQISEDFEHEKPLWRLTCYGHSKYLPCDIIGDLSFEELRASAYDDAKRGTGIQSIVEKERTLLSSKLIEFENLLRNPYTPPQSSTFATQNTFPGPSANVFPQAVQNNAPPSVSSFSQLGTNFNSGFQMRPATPNNAFSQFSQFQAPTQISNPAAPNNAFAQVNQFQAPNQLSNASAPNNAFAQVNQFQASTQISNPAAPNNPFGQLNQFQAPSQISNAPQKNAFAFGNPGLMGTQPSTQPSVSSFPATTTTFSNAFSPAASTSPFNVAPAPVSIIQMPQNTNSNSNADKSIWFKDDWKRGEIPEEAPPAEVIY